MLRYLFDTNHASAILKGDKDLRQRISLAQGQFGISLPTVGELWFMVFNSIEVTKNTEALKYTLRQFKHWEYDQEAAVEFGRIRAELRRNGRPIPAIDVQIAAIARANDLTVLTSDEHLSYVSDLNVENWLA